MLKKILPVALLITLIAWGVYDYIVANDGQDAQVDPVQQDGTVTVGLKRGNVAPDFTLHSLSGEEMKLSDFRGQHVILNFWATWCPPCRAEMPDMQTYYSKHADKDNFVILAVNLTSTESNRDKISTFIEEFGLSFPIVLDEKNDVATTYEVMGYPTSYFIDKHGIVRYKVVGPMDRSFMRKQVRRM